MELGKASIPRILHMHNIDVLEDFECLNGVNPLLFSQLCICYYADIVPAVVNEIQHEDRLAYTEEITKNREGKIVNKKCQNFTISADRPIGIISIGNDHQPICVPGSAKIIVLGKVLKLVTKGSYMIELAAHNNFPSGVVVNQSYVTPKAGQVAVILVNNTNRNIWICHPLLAAKVYEVELHPWQYCSVLFREGNTIKVGFQPVVLQRWKEVSRPIKWKSR